MKTFKGPGWPDLRGWATIGFFGLTFYGFHMMEKNPALLAVSSFMQVFSTLIGGGVLLIAMNLFGGTKSGAETSAKMVDVVANSTPAPAMPPVAPSSETPAP